jgi:hypothetical protein
LHSTQTNTAPPLAVFCLSSVFEGKSAALIHFQSSSKKIAALLRHQTTRNLPVKSVVINVAIYVAVLLTLMLLRVLMPHQSRGGHLRETPLTAPVIHRNNHVRA